jgi:preprotein translocase subunit SecG
LVALVVLVLLQQTNVLVVVVLLQTNKPTQHTKLARQTMTLW